jgi:hypothetical protein
VGDAGALEGVAQGSDNVLAVLTVIVPLHAEMENIAGSYPRLFALMNTLTTYGSVALCVMGGNR